MDYKSNKDRENVLHAIESTLQIHLGVCDKLILNNFYPEYRETKNIGNFKSLVDFLNGLGYNSKRLKENI